ncbi:Transport permease protein [Bordetella tumbae]|uniref:ABC transporter permease n=1 Tax=Bordetella tumbae TaxID=1649139 RepID=UPI0039EE998C
MNNAGFFKGLSLAWMLSKRDLKNRYAGSYAGIAWHIGVPLLYASINVAVFSILVGGRMGGGYENIPFALFYFVPFSIWIFFQETVNRSTGILKEYSYLINKISFPFWVLPLVPLASAFVNQVVILSIVAVLMAFYGIAPGADAWGYLFVWMACLVFSLGVAYAVSALTVYVPDLSQIVPVIVNILYWLTPILYPASLVESHGGRWAKAFILEYNPFYYWAELSRRSMFDMGVTFSADKAGFLIVISLVALGVGALVFKKLKSGFADVL